LHPETICLLSRTALYSYTLSAFQLVQLESYLRRDSEKKEMLSALYQGNPLLDEQEAVK
jgi:hypothetical protein